MATNPNNAIGTNAAYGGRTSPKAFNDVLSAFDGRGILSGWKVAPNSGMTIALGGDGDNRDVAIAEDNAGNMTTVNNIIGSPVSFTIAAAPASQSRIDAIVVYVNNPPQGASTATDNYGAVGILDVQGTVASTPTKPNDSDIRTAITADGASGATAYYVVLGYVKIPNGTTTITSNLIEQGGVVVTNIVSNDIIDGIVTTDKIASGAVTNAKLANSAVTTTKIDNNAVSASKINWNGWAGTDVTSAITGVRGTIHNISSVNKGYDGYYQIYMRIDTTNTVNANNAVATFNTTTMPLASDIYVIGVAPWYNSGTVCIWRFTTTGEIYVWQPGNNPFPTSTMITLNARFKYN